MQAQALISADSSNLLPRIRESSDAQWWLTAAETQLSLSACVEVSWHKYCHWHQLQSRGACGMLKSLHMIYYQQLGI